MKPSMERRLDPMKLAMFFVAVTLTRGATTPSILNSTDDTTDLPTMFTNPTLLPTTLLNSSFQPTATTTDAPNVVTGDTSLSPNTPDVSSSSFPDTTTAIVPTLQTGTFANATSPPLLVDSTATPDNGTSTQGPFSPDDSISNTQIDPIGRLTTPALVPSTTPTVTPRTTYRQPQVAFQFTPPPFTGINQRNPYSNQLPRPRPLSPLTQQQQQRFLNPWLFAGSDYFPYMFLLSQQQSNQQGPLNSLSNGIAPLYFTGIDLELWPWLMNQQRSPQQQLALQQQQQLRRSQPQPLPQPSRQPFANQNQFPQGQTRVPQQSPTRNNLANLFWLNELYF